MDPGIIVAFVPVDVLAAVPAKVVSVLPAVGTAMPVAAVDDAGFDKTGLDVPGFGAACLEVVGIEVAELESSVDAVFAVVEVAAIADDTNVTAPAFSHGATTH